MIKELNLHTANWNCPSIEMRKVPGRPDHQLMQAMANPDYIKKQMGAGQAAGAEGARYILPLWQNLEAVALGTNIMNRGIKKDSFYIPGDYCLQDLSQLQGLEPDFLSDPLIQAVLETIPAYAGQNLVLEAAAPFSILAALMNPLDLFLCFEKESKLLIEILHKIADASILYIKACIKAGCRVISLADPVGTMDLVGEDYYRRFCGESEIHLMEGCQPFLDQAIMHICFKMSQSLLIAGLARTEPYGIPDDPADAMDILHFMADDPKVHFTGMTCLHDRMSNLRGSLIIRLKPRSIQCLP